MMNEAHKKAVAYSRTSSAANVGADKDSERRQLEAIRIYSKRAGVEIVGEFYDAAVSGADAVNTRPGFAAMIDRLATDGVRVIIVESASRFARDLMVQEVGYRMLRNQGIELIAADNPASFLDDGPTSKLIRQVLGAVSEFEKAMVVAKLKGARDRKRLGGKKVEGRKCIGERPGGTDVVAMAKRLYRLNPKTGKHMPLRDIADKLKEAGFKSNKGTAFSPSVVARMLDPKTASST